MKEFVREENTLYIIWVKIWRMRREMVLKGEDQQRCMFLREGEKSVVKQEWGKKAESTWLRESVLESN